MPISRTHRPRQFKDVTGQRHITETLQKEVASGILGHAFLFSGPRGIGKTTTARILAKALLNEQTDNGEPPIESIASTEIDLGACIDLIELDAASHTGVENVREAIIEHVRFAPSRWKRKVYIIDECHMLSTSAWNALLKTLEEPPTYAFFILATTELHKVPETIVSRCQRFEFRRIDAVDLAARVTTIANEEGMRIDEDVVREIVHASDGCVRDAESLLDQLASLGTKKITREIATLVLPASRIPETAKLLKTCLVRDVGSSLSAARVIVESGVPPIEILNDLLAVIRALIRCEDPSEKRRLEIGDEGDLSIVGLHGAIRPCELGAIALMLIERRRDAKTGTDPQFALELAILAIAGNLLAQGLSYIPPSQRPIEPIPSKPPIITPPIETTDAKKDQKKTNTTDHRRADEPMSHEMAESLELRAQGQSISDLVVPQPSLHQPSTQIDLNDLRILWNTIIREVEKENRSLPFILKVAKPIATDADRIMLGFSYDFHKEKIIDDLKMKLIVEKTIANVLKCDKVIIDGIVQGTGTESETIQQGPCDIVAKVLETFGGEVVSN